MSRIAFIGLGVMGAPMAGHLLKAGHDVRAFNRSLEGRAAWTARFGLDAAPSIEAAAAGADMVFTCVSADRDLEAVFAAAAPHMQAGALFVDHSTTSARIARVLAAEAAAKGIGFVDAPVSGGQAGAENGRLTIMAGGEEAHVETARPVMSAYAAGITRIGPSGAGQLAKMVNQICIAGLLQGLSEGLAFAKAADLDVAAVIAAISKGAAQSWQMENRWKTMDEGRFDFGFAVDLMRKDLGLVLEEGRANGASLAVTALVDQFYAEVQAKGGGRLDTSSLITRLL